MSRVFRSEVFRALRTVRLVAIVAALLVLGGSARAQVGPPPSVVPRAAPIPPAKLPGIGDQDAPLPVIKADAESKSQRPRGGINGAGGLEPFGVNLFIGNFLRARADGLNPEYVIVPGDQVTVKTWGAVEMDETLVVDSQGNIFLPGVGPIHLAGTPNAKLTDKVKQGLGRVYARHLEVYTNLMTANPVAVFVTGGVERPGRYAGIPSDSVLFFLDQAGGIDPQLGSYRKISVLRGGKPLVDVDLYDFILNGRLPPLQFKDGDTVLVHQRGPVVELRGSVAKPALLEFPRGTISGGDALAVIPGAARATQVTIEGIRGGAPISRTLSVRRFSAFSLQDGDTITLRDDGRADTILVRVEGEYQGPSVLAVRRGSRLVDVLNYVPIDPKLANPEAIHVRRASVARAQKDSIDDSLFRLERSALLALSQSRGESAIRVEEAQLTLEFVKRARLIQPLGRVVTARAGRQSNIVLEPDDVIVVPARTNVVRISGEVMMAQAVMFQSGRTIEEYVQDAGGYTDRADESRVIVVHPNAEVAMGDPGGRIRPGDEILIPPEVDSKTLQSAVDVTQVIYQVAVSAAVIVAIL